VAQEKFRTTAASRRAERPSSSLALTRNRSRLAGELDAVRTLLPTSFAAGADLKAVQELLGHSSITITADTYTHVLPELAREIAENVARLIPRTPRTGQNQTGKTS